MLQTFSINSSNCGGCSEKPIVKDFNGKLSTKQVSTQASSSFADEPSFQVAEKIPTMFEWYGNNNNTVYLTGSFCSWKQKFQMIKKGEKFLICLYLPRGVYYYKFVVDGQWDYSRTQPISYEAGVINNVIDTTKNEKENLNLNSGNSHNKINSNYHSNFSNFNLKQNQFKSPIPCPDIYKADVDTGKTLPNVTLNHAVVKSNNGKVVCVSSTQRVRHKKILLLFYKKI